MLTLTFSFGCAPRAVSTQEDFVRKIVWLAALLAMLTTLVLSGCGRSTDTAAGGNGDKGTVGIAMPTKSSERWVADGKNMVDQFQAMGYATDLQYGDDVVQNQVSQIENMITKGVKLLVIAPIDGSSLTTTLQHAADAKIPVISYDRLIKGTPNVDYYATFDNFKVGVQHRVVRRFSRRQQRDLFLRRRDECAQALHRQRQAGRQERPDLV
jgi:ABC-type xylose transport system substrate-binding protein